MERTRYSIMITGDVNQYIEGRMLGIVDGVRRSVDKKGGYPIRRIDGYSILTFDATIEEYEIIKEMITSCYGNMNEFKIGFINF